MSATVNKLPLFLPSLDSSPAASFTPPQRRAPLLVGGRSSSLGFYVLVPPAPRWVQRDRARLHAQRLAAWHNTMDVDAPREEEEKEKAPQREGEEEEDVPQQVPEPEIDVTELRRRRARGMYHNTQNEGEEAAMLETCARLREVSCKWFACGAVLNSVESLVAHLQEIHAQEDDTVTCMWDICGEAFVSSGQLALHAEAHVLSSIPCAYQDCEDLFHTPGALVEHNRGHAEAKDDREWELLPSFRPTAPAEGEMPDPVVPESVSQWALLAPGVEMPEITKERHMTLGPWVLRNITAPALNVRAKRYNAAVPLSGVRAHQDYEFVEATSVHYSSLPSRPARVRDLADLNSAGVTELVAKGEMVLWPPEGSEHLHDERSEVEVEGNPAPEAPAPVPVSVPAEIASAPSPAPVEPKGEVDALNVNDTLPMVEPSVDIIQSPSSFIVGFNAPLAGAVASPSSPTVDPEETAVEGMLQYLEGLQNVQ
ncbi:hypothetical protein C8F04DRAFT_1069802 [Mycena alexandri]|uniref:C2H2-type domain-containing protein n=1 Tax=Mycena alexandri TaxID=1745969 RepID=A0AAD6TE33_9AGAR|nr:hypothetical protein C8F04DRAFT_1069802 [Mycena alexandri]